MNILTISIEKTAYLQIIIAALNKGGCEYAIRATRNTKTHEIVCTVDSPSLAKSGRRVNHDDVLYYLPHIIADCLPITQRNEFIGLLHNAACDVDSVEFGSMNASKSHVAKFLEIHETLSSL
jgi:hypothetical protein